MSGHSKWSTIKRAKGVVDAKRSKIFTRLTREVTLAARTGVDPELNPRLRLAIQKARDNNMPRDNIDRAIKKVAGGDGNAATLDEVTYEAYGPGGVAILLEVVTENRNRTAADVKAALNKAGGSMGESGSVSWMFKTNGVLTIPAAGDEADEIALRAIDAGAEDFTVDDDAVEIYCAPGAIEEIRTVLESEGVTVANSEVTQIPTAMVTVDPKLADRTIRLLEKLEDLDDVQRVSTNADFPQELIADV